MSSYGYRSWRTANSKTISSIHDDNELISREMRKRLWNRRRQEQRFFHGLVVRRVVACWICLLILISRSEVESTSTASWWTIPRKGTASSSINRNPIMSDKTRLPCLCLRHHKKPISFLNQQEPCSRVIRRRRISRRRETGVKMRSSIILFWLRGGNSGIGGGANVGESQSPPLVLRPQSQSTSGARYGAGSFPSTSSSSGDSTSSNNPYGSSSTYRPAGTTSNTWSSYPRTTKTSETNIKSFNKRAQEFVQPLTDWWISHVSPNIKNWPKIHCRVEPTTTLKIRKTFRPLKTIVQLGADFNTQLSVWQFKSSWEDALIGGKLTLAGRELQFTKSWQLSVGAMGDLVTRLKLRAAVDLKTWKAYARIGFRTERLAPINIMEGFTVMKQIPLDGNKGHVKLEVKANFALPEPEIEYSTEIQRSVIGMGDIEINIDELNLVLDY